MWEIWTHQGFQTIKNIEKQSGKEAVLIELDNQPSMSLICHPEQEIFVNRRNNIESLIKAKNLIPVQDAVMANKEKQLNVFIPIKNVEKITGNFEFYNIELDESIVHYSFEKKDKGKFKIIENKNETVKNLAEIKKGHYIQVGDFFKEILSVFEGKQSINLAIDQQDYLYFANGILVRGL